MVFQTISLFAWTRSFDEALFGGGQDSTAPAFYKDLGFDDWLFNIGAENASDPNLRLANLDTTTGAHLCVDLS